MVEGTLDIHADPFGSIGLIDVDCTELNNSVTFNIRKVFVLVQVLGCKFFPFTTINLEAPRSSCITAILSTIQLQQVVSSSCIHTEVK